MGKQTLFQYTIRDKVFCRSEQQVFIDSSTVIVLGERDDWMVYDEQHKGFVKTKAFMVHDKGIEYGTEQTVSGLDFSCSDCGSGDAFQVFASQFVKQFE